MDFVDLMQSRSICLTDDQENEEKFWFSDQWTIEPLYDGVNYQILIDENGDLKFQGRKRDYKKNNKFEQLDRIVKDIEEMQLPKNTLFEGILTFNNDKNEMFRFLNISRIDQSFKENCTFYIRDIIFYNNKAIHELPLFDRIAFIKRNFKETLYIKIQESYNKNKRQVFEKFKESFQNFNFRDLCSPYSFKQSMASRIYKVPCSYFMIILDVVVNEKEEKFRNMVLALKGAQIKNNEITYIMNIPVHSNNNRTYLYKNRENLKGKVFEFLASEKDLKEEKYQEARFLKIRFDKTEKDCIF